MATLFLSLILSVCFVLRGTDGQFQAQRFVLNGVNYTNGSTVLRTYIGQVTAALHCTTDRDGCCAAADGRAVGEFYFPNGDQVPILGNDPIIQSQRTYYRNRGRRFVRLNRQSVAMETGQFRCEIPDANGTMVDLFINIADIFISITASGTNTAGETYSLECSVTVTGSTDQPTITWLDPMNNTVPSEMVTTTGSMSTLTFNPLAASHAGTYTCIVTTGGVNETQTSTVIVNVDISLSIIASGTNTAGETYSLECSATVTGSTDQPNITWLNPVPSKMVTTTGSMSTLTFNPLADSHAGTYTCRVTAGGVTETQTSTVIVNVITAQVTHSSIGPLTAGQTGFSLSCDVTGTENLNTPTFTYLWRRNGGVKSGQQGSTLSLSPLTASNAGEYNCSVIVSSTSLSSTVTVNSINTDTLSLLLLQHNVSLTANSSNPILFGSDVTLTCTVELSPAVDVPVTVNTVWTGPSTNSFASSSTLQEALTLYRSELVLKSVESANSGQYTCSTEVVSGVKELASTNIEIVDGLFQLRLKAVDICTQWHITRSSKEAIKYVNYIDLALVEVIERHCKCRFPVDNLLEGSFSCEESPDLMTYRSAVVGTHNFNGSLIVGFIQDWVSSGPRIKIDRSHVRVDSSCPVALTSLDEPECGLKEVCLTSADDPHNFTVCANNLDNRNVATCFQNCITNN